MEAFGSLEFFRLPPGLPERRYTNTLLPDLDEDERNEIVDLMGDIREALRENRAGDAEALRSELDDALFYLEG